MGGVQEPSILLLFPIHLHPVLHMCHHPGCSCSPWLLHNFLVAELLAVASLVAVVTFAWCVIAQLISNLYHTMASSRHMFPPQFLGNVLS